MKTIGLYVHIPFCATKCTFCALYSGSFSPTFHVKYFGNLIHEIKERSLPFKDYLVDTIYFGGGTPSHVDAQYISETIKVIRVSYSVIQEAEVSIEINPESLTQVKFDAYMAAGINRFSFGVQAYDNETLTSLNRATRAEDVDVIVELLNKNNFKNYNLDMIYAFPNLKFEVLEKTLDYILKVKPAHISAYNYSLEEPSLMAVQIKTGKLALPSTKIIKDQNEYVSKRLKSGGYIQYELSNYSLPGYECKHNSNFWAGGEYLGFGVSAVSYIDDTFIENERDIKRYIDIGYVSLQNFNHLSPQEVISKKVLLGLRLKKGINIDFLFAPLSDLQVTKFQDITWNNIQKQILAKNLVLHETNGSKTLKMTEKGMKSFDFVCARVIDES